MNSEERKKLSWPFSFNPPKGYRFLLSGERIQKGDCFLSAKLEEMRLKYIAEECLELFDHRLPEEKQCSGWFRLKRLVIEGKEQLTDDDLKLFHPILRDAIKNNWSNIRQCTVD